MNIHHILVPVDFSEVTLTTTDWAQELAVKFSARLTLCHVLQPAFPSHNEDEAACELRKLANAIAPGIQTETALETGIPWDRIVNRTKDGVCLVVMGTHGWSGLKHIRLGSVAERVVRHAQCPVLIVREHPAVFGVVAATEKGRPASVDSADAI